MSNEPKPSERAMAAAQMLTERNLLSVHAHPIHGTLGVYPIPEVAAIIDQHLAAHDELLAACKLVIATVRVWRHEDANLLIPEHTVKGVSQAVALAEPGEKEKVTP